MPAAAVTPQKYLARIGVNGGIRADLATLEYLHQAHLYSVPFENLSIHSRERIRLEEAWLLEKIVRRRRGGFCYECNGAFNWLLTELGFDVTRHSARVFNEKRDDYGPPFDHMVLLVRLDREYVVDVGFGEGFRKPLALQMDSEQIQGYGRYRLRAGEDQYIYERWDKGAWIPQYTFTDRPYPLEAFSVMCRHHQTSPDSPFTRNWAASLATKNGRISLVEEDRDGRLITTEGGKRKETVIMGLENNLILLKEMFNLEGFRLDRR